MPSRGASPVSLLKRPFARLAGLDELSAHRYAPLRWARDASLASLRSTSSAPNRNGRLRLDNFAGPWRTPTRTLSTEPAAIELSGNPIPGPYVADFAMIWIDSNERNDASRIAIAQRSCNSGSVNEETNGCEPYRDLECLAFTLFVGFC